MKASNPVVMVQAYRLLVAEMHAQGWDYPLHLGVTEAGEGEDGRMKSAIGIGTLLQVFFSLVLKGYSGRIMCVLMYDSLLHVVYHSSQCMLIILCS